MKFHAEVFTRLGHRRHEERLEDDLPFPAVSAAAVHAFHHGQRIRPLGVGSWRLGVDAFFSSLLDEHLAIRTVMTS
jgi:hypothetical protein